jgi:hypothetical protein
MSAKCLHKICTPTGIELSFHPLPVYTIFVHCLILNVIVMSYSDPNVRVDALEKLTSSLNKVNEIHEDLSQPFYDALLDEIKIIRRYQIRELPETSQNLDQKDF